MGFTDKMHNHSINSSPSRTYKRIHKHNPLTGVNVSKKSSSFSFNTKSRMGNNKKVPTKKIVSRILTIGGGIIFFLAVIGSVAAGIILKDIDSKLPEPGQLLERDNTQSTVIYDRNGKELYNFLGMEGEESINRTYIKLDDLPDDSKRAIIASVLAAEDSAFFEHKGLDWIGIVRCGFISVQSYMTGGGMEGGCGASTISQQLVRNTLMYDAFGDEAYERSTLFKTIQRKIREMLMTMQVEQTMTKDQIIEMYVNEIYLGGVNYGFEAGAYSTYAQHASELDLAEASLLAGIIQSPSVYNPVLGSQPDKATERQTYVLDQIIKHKDEINKVLLQENLKEITDEEIELARQEVLTFQKGKVDMVAPHFTFYVREWLVNQFGEEAVLHGGLKVTTTLDLDLQNIATEEIKTGVSNYANPYNMGNGALVSIDPNTFQVVAMVGSVDYNNTEDRRIDGNVNIATSARQMGSSMKPYTYLTAFTRGFSPGMQAGDLNAYSFGYNASNWDGGFYGPLTAREALVKSRNISALYVIQMVGIPAFLETTDKLGIQSLTNRDNYGLSLTLGSGEITLLEHTAAYAVFANEGVKKPVTAVLKVEDRDGDILYEWKDSEGERVFDEKEIYLLNWTLCDYGGYWDQLLTNYYNDGGQRVFCGKTGTNDGPTDLVAMMYTKNIVTGLWVGNNDNTIAIPGAYSTNIPLPMINSYMKRISGKYPYEGFARPAGIASTTVCKDTGLVPNEKTSCPKETTVYIVGQAPKADKREVIKVCKANGLIPTNLAQAEKFGLVESKTLMNYIPENANQVDNWYKSMGPSYLKTKPESGECKIPLGPNNAPVVDITSPADGSSATVPDNITVTADARALETVTKVAFYLGSTLIGEDSSAPYEVTYQLPSSLTTGSYNITATVYDNKGLSGSDSIALQVTNNTPELTFNFITPTDGSTVPIGNIPISIKASRPIDKASCYLIYSTISGDSAEPIYIDLTKVSATNWGGSITKPIDLIAGPASLGCQVDSGYDSSGWSVGFTITN